MPARPTVSNSGYLSLEVPSRRGVNHWTGCHTAWPSLSSGLEAGGSGSWLRLIMPGRQQVQDSGSGTTNTISYGLRHFSMPTVMCGRDTKLLAYKVDGINRVNHRPHDVSGGDQQH